MNKYFFLLFALFTFSAFGQVVYLGGYTTTQRNSIVPGSGHPILYNTTDNEFQRWNGANWEDWGGSDSKVLPAKDTLLTSANDELTLNYTHFQSGADAGRRKLLRKDNGRIDLTPSAETIPINTVWRARTGADNDTIAVNPANGYELVFEGTNTGNAGYITGPYSSMYIEKVGNDTLLVSGTNLVQYNASGGGITLEGSTTGFVASDVTNIDLTYPAGIQAGDVIVILAALEDSSPGPKFDNTTGKPAGFTFIQTAGTTETDVWPGAFYKVATGSESGTINVPTVNSLAGRMAGVVARFSGVNTNSVIGQTGAATNSGSQVTTNPLATVTTTTAKEYVMAWAVVHGSDITGYAGSGTLWNDQGNINPGDGVQGSLIANWGTTEQQTAGAVPVYTLNWNEQDGSSGFVFSLKSN